MDEHCILRWLLFNIFTGDWVLLIVKFPLRSLS